MVTPPDPRRWRALALALAVCAAASAVQADEMTVDRRTMHPDESVTITITLTGAFAGGEVSLRSRNLRVVGQPSTSSEFSWVNGAMTKQRVLTYTAEPVGVGPATAGPVEVKGEGGQTETLPAVAIQVVADEELGTSDPALLLRQLVAAGRPPCFIIPEVDRRNVYEGEQVTVTWYAYNAAQVQRWQVESVPRLSDFWAEDLDVPNTPARVFIGDTMMQKVPIRRVALFPLRSGRFAIGGIRATAAVLQRNPGAFGAFEGSVTEVRVPSPPVPVTVNPIPSGPPVDIVGNVNIQCSAAVQKDGGPITLAAGLRGQGNLRSAVAPHFETKPDGDAEVQSLSFDILKDGSGMMERRWRYVIFPSKAGAFAVPPLVLHVFNPVTGQRSALQCPGSTVQVAQVVQKPAPAATPEPAAPQQPAAWRKILPWAGAIAAIVVIALVVIPRAGRASHQRRDVTAVIGNGVPKEIRERLDALLRTRGVDPAVVARESSERGDAWRGVSSLLDGVARNRIAWEDAEAELRERIADLLATVAK